MTRGDFVAFAMIGEIGVFAPSLVYFRSHHQSGSKASQCDTRPRQALRERMFRWGVWATKLSYLHSRGVLFPQSVGTLTEPRGRFASQRRERTSTTMVGSECAEGSIGRRYNPTSCSLALLVQTNVPMKMWSLRNTQTCRNALEWSSTTLKKSSDSYFGADYRSTDLLCRPSKENIFVEHPSLNEGISCCRKLVNRIYEKVVEVWPFASNKPRKANLLSETNMEDEVAALLTNFHNCLYCGMLINHPQITPMW